MEFSLNPTTNYVSSLTLTPSSGTVSPTTIYVRLRGFYFYSPSGLTIQISSIGASSLTQTVSTAYVVPSPQVVTTTPGSRVGTGTVTLSVTVSTNCTADWYAQSSGGTALATSTLSFTTPSITATTTYYVEARDTSGNNCGVTPTRTAVVATITPPPVPAPLIGTLGTSAVFWGTLSQSAGTYYYYNANGVKSLRNTPNYIGFYPPYPSTTDNYWVFDGTTQNPSWDTNLENSPPNNLNYALMFYGTLPPVFSSNLYHIWSRESNTIGWDIIWEPTTPNRFTFRTQGNSDLYINYPRVDSSMRLFTFNYSQYDTNVTKIELYVNSTKINEVIGSNNHMKFDKSNTVSNLRFAKGSSNDAFPYIGYVSNVLMYNTTLTQAQITSIYQYFSGNTPTSTSTNTGGSTNSTGTGTFFTLY